MHSIEYLLPSKQSSNYYYNEQWWTRNSNKEMLMEILETQADSPAESQADSQPTLSAEEIRAQVLAESREKEKQKQHREQQLRKERDELKAQLAEVEAAKQAILRNGWDINALTTIKNSNVAAVDNPLIDELQAQIRSLKEENSRRDQVIADERELKNIIDYVSGNGEKYELIQAFKLESEVQSLIKHTFKENGKILSYTEAADLIEKHLEKQEREHAALLKKTKKAKSLFNEGIDVADIKVSKNKGIDAEKAENIVTKAKEKVETKTAAAPANRNDLITRLINKHSKK